MIRTSLPCAIYRAPSSSDLVGFILVRDLVRLIVVRRMEDLVGVSNRKKSKLARQVFCNVKDWI